MLQQNLKAMVAPATEGGMDIVIVSTTSPEQEAFWQGRLQAGCGQICRADARVLVVCEDWDGGAGNGLGTLYAIRKAALKARELYDIDLLAELRGGAAVALYHTAGKGTRLAPLPGSEGNNKPAVKLPGLLEIDGQQRPMTILEGVIRQTAIYARSRHARVSVFWGDQIFVPSATVDYDAAHHVDILARLAPMPDAETWKQEGLDKYGLIAVGADGSASQVEKIDHATARRLLDEGVIEVDGGIGVSLGSFSMSAPMTEALLAEFAPELDARREKLDTDPHFWMPMTLDQATYEQMMADKDVPPAEARAHYARMQAFVEGFRQQHDGPLFGCVDVGDACYWWDYGQLRYYLRENRKLTAAGEENDAMRAFFGVIARRDGNDLGPDVDVDDQSVVLGCRIARGRIRRSVLVGVCSEAVTAEASVLVNVTAGQVQCRDALGYNVVERGEFACDAVRADAFVPDRGQFKLHTCYSRDGRDDWDECLPGNDVSYAELHRLNQAADATEAAAMARAAADEVAASLEDDA